MARAASLVAHGEPMAHRSVLTIVYRCDVAKRAASIAYRTAEGRRLRRTVEPAVTVNIVSSGHDNARDESFT